MSGSALEETVRGREEFETIAHPDTREEKDKTRLLASFHRRFLDTYHHRPERLCVSVNGIPVASLDVFNNDAEPLSFIEVFSEQQIRLAMLNANSGPDNPVENEANVSLSDERELQVSFLEEDPGLSIRLGYTDPQIEGWERLASLGLIESPALQDNA